jgi:hypothetical protein
VVGFLPIERSLGADLLTTSRAGSPHRPTSVVLTHPLSSAAEERGCVVRHTLSAMSGRPQCSLRVRNSAWLSEVGQVNQIPTGLICARSVPGD